MVLHGPQGNSLGLLYALANKFAVFSQVYSTTAKQVSFFRNATSAAETLSWLSSLFNQPQLMRYQHHQPKYHVLISRFPLFLSICYIRGVYLFHHSVLEFVYVNAFRRLCNVPEVRRPLFDYCRVFCVCYSRTRTSRNIFTLALHGVCET